MTQTQFGCAMIIGAGSPQGRVLGEVLAAAGTEVLALQAAPASGVDALDADIGSVEGLARALDTLRQRGPVDLLINCATGPGDEPCFLRRHGESAVVLARAAVSLMPAAGGAVVSLIPLDSLLCEGGETPAAANGAFLARFSQSLQAEVAGTGVRVRALCLQGEGGQAVADALWAALSGDQPLCVPDAHARERVRRSLGRQARLLGQ